MANITKLVNKGIYSGARTQIWDTLVDLNDSGGAIATGDIFRIENSLSKPAHSMTIDVEPGAGSLVIRLNAAQKVYPRRPAGEMGPISETYNNVAQGQEYLDTTTGTLTLLAGESWSWVNEVKISTVQIVSKTADFTLIVS